jgi:thiamine biosynthesis lipoprotein
MPRAALVLLVVLLACCSRDDFRLVEHRLFAMATWIDVTLPAAATREHPRLIAEIEAELRVFERDFYPWADGELSRLNAALSAGAAFEASPALVALLAAAQRAAEASDGAFDPGVGGFVELYGFHDATAPPPPLPDDAAIAALLASSGSILDLEIDGMRVAGRQVDGVPRSYTLDLGGIAKGAAVDRIAERLIDLAIAPALVNAGGNLRVVGDRPVRPWRIGIREPRAEALLGAIELGDGDAVSSSGDYERFRESGGERLHHIIDPRTGRPVAHTQAVTVIAANAELADAASTALFVAGPAAWLEVAGRLGVTAALRVDASGRVEMTRAMRDRFEAGTSGDSAIIAVVD